MDDGAVDAAYLFLRRHTTGDLRFDEHIRPIRYVIGPDGRLAAPLMVAMLRAFDTVLFVPELAEGAMEVQVTLEQFDEHGPAGSVADRWRIHHGDPPDVNWAWLDIDAVRYERFVIDGEGLMRANPLAAEEARICRHMNQEHADALFHLCRHFAHIEIEKPVMVAIDPLGIDVRGRFDIIRVEATEPMDTAEDAHRVLRDMSEFAREAPKGAEDHE